MDFSVSNLLAGFIFSVIGLWVFREGRKRTNIPWTVLGLLLMLYSIFTPNATWSWFLGLDMTYPIHFSTIVRLLYLA